MLALLSGLFAKLQHLTFRLLTHRSGAHQLFVLTLGLLNDLISLLFGCGDELVPSLHQLSSPLNLLGQGVPNGIQNFDGITLIHQTPATERNATALQKDILQLIQMVEDSEAGVAHVTGVGKPN